MLLCLAFDPETFEQRSVALPDTDWVERFRALLSSAEYRLLQDEVGEVPEGDAIYVRTNEWLLDVAQSESGADGPLVLLVWDGQTGDGPGGTWDVASRADIDLADADRVCIVHPRAPDAARP